MKLKLLLAGLIICASVFAQAPPHGGCATSAAQASIPGIGNYGCVNNLWTLISPIAPYYPAGRILTNAGAPVNPCTTIGDRYTNTLTQAESYCGTDMVWHPTIGTAFANSDPSAAPYSPGIVGDPLKGPNLTFQGVIYTCAGATGSPCTYATNPAAFPTQSDQTVSCNNSGGVAAPAGCTPSQTRSLLGLGTAATQNTTAFDASGSAAAAQAASDPSGSANAAQSASAQKSANGSDFTNAATVRTNLGFSGPYFAMPTVTGDGTLNAGTGALAVNKIAGVAIPSGVASGNGTSLGTATNSQIGAYDSPNRNTLLAVNAAGADAGAKIATQIAALPSTGGAIDASGITGAQAWNSNIFSGVTKPVTMILGQGVTTINTSMTIPANVTIQLSQGAMLAAPVGVTVTWASASAIPVTQQIFATPIAGTIIWKAGPLAPGYFGSTGSDTTDDTAAFVAYSSVASASARANSTPSSDGNKLGAIKLVIPAGTYLITSPQAFMAASYTLRSVGLTIEGAGIGETTIDYRPSTPGPLFSNNDAWLYVRISDIAFTCNDSASDFMDSFSTGGAQNYRFNSVAWFGTWGNGLKLTGSNNNSEMRWIDSTIAASFTTAFLYTPSAGSDQFLNYWFNQTNVNITGGNFIDAARGGHFDIDHCDFSGLTGVSSPTILFALRGNNHNLGTTFMSVRNSRFELKTNQVSVLYSEWGGYGSVLFDQDDFSSQLGPYPAATVAFEINTTGSAGMAIYKFANSFLIGSIKVDVSNNDWGYRRNITFEDVELGSFDDYSSAFNISTPTGANYGAFPSIECIRCRGIDNNFVNVTTAWAATTPYNTGQKVYSNGYVYASTSANGTNSGTTAPHGRTASISDGGVTWATLDLYSGSDYAQSGIIRNTAFINNGVEAVRTTTANSGTNFNHLPLRISSSVVGFSRVILPVNALVTRVVLVVSPGAAQATTGTFVVRNDNYTPVTILTQAISPLSAGIVADLTLPTPMATGTDIGSRTIVLQANTDVTVSPSGYFVVYYQ